MIPIRTYRQYWLDMRSRITGLGRVLFARTEDELAMIIKEVSDRELLLVVVIPSADTMAPDHDNIREVEIGIVYALMKVNRNNMDAEDLITVQESTQNAIKRVKQLFMLDAEDEESPYHLLSRDMNLSKMHTDPEFNFLGCDGYSITLEFNTAGF